MIKNYIKITVRSILRNKLFSIINIFGLAVGITCAILILLWVQDELSYDKFHKNAEITYLVLRGDNTEMTALTSKSLATALRNEIPEVRNAVSIMQVPDNIKILVQTDNEGYEEKFTLADSNIFKIFSIKMLQGDADKTLTAPMSVVITRHKAKKYFGNENALGKTLTVSLFGKKHTFTVTGVFEDLPANSHFTCELIFPENMMQSFGAKEPGWRDQSFETFIQVNNKLSGASEIQQLSNKIKECELKNSVFHNKSLQYSLLLLTDIHLYGSGIKFLETTGDIKYIRIFIAAAVMLLLIAGINYSNLSTALSLKRTKEVGIKKTLGAGRKALLLQFFGESILLSTISMLFALLLVEIFIPGFNQLSGKQIVIKYNSLNFILNLLLITISVGLISGSSPAIILSSFQPIQILKSKMNVGAAGLNIQKLLLVFQFSLSTIIIISTIIVVNQLNYIRNSKLGFDKENLICIQMAGDINSKYDILKNEIHKLPGVLSSSRSEAIQSGSLSGTGIMYRKDDQSNAELKSWVLYTDYDLLSTYKFKIQQGRYFSEEYPTDKTSAFVINEAAAKAMEMKTPLGQYLYLRGRLGKIIGVINDFHFASFHNSIEPLVFIIPDSSQASGRYRIITVRYKSTDPGEIIFGLERIWKEKLPGTPFSSYFYDESLNNLYKSEFRMGIIFNCFSFISIFIACVGLFGLVSISIERRIREIGIRKVLGASVSNIALILSREYLALVFISNLIAIPVSYYFMDKWLQDFVYRINISWVIFAVSALIVLLIALTTVSVLTARAAVTNPVKSLKYE